MVLTASASFLTRQKKEKYPSVPWVSGKVMHYSDFRISGFEFFRIFAIYGNNSYTRLMKFGMNDLQGGTEDFYYSDIRFWIFSDIFTLRTQY